MQDITLTKNYPGYLTSEKTVDLVGSDDAAMIRGKRIVLMDDVISTGGSLLAMEHLVELAGGIVVDRIAALAEGAAAQRKDIKFLAPLPVFNADGTIK